MDNLKQTVGTNLKEARSGAGITQEALAKEMNMVRAQYSKYERGIIELNYAQISWLCGRLNITPNDLFGF